ncbi:MAG TPA: NAD(P)-dependent oxidoreductase [Rickettsiales bacterium]|nr:NAD(P)-dependent oxidoreductase [Rickettsiales bacterium]
MKKILLTGGSGFIGKNILESELSQKYQIIAPSSKELNLASDDDVKNFLEKNKFDIIIHSACKPGHRNAKDNAGIFYSNSRMFFNLLKYCGGTKIINIGSGAIYDMRHYMPKMKEEYFATYIPQDEHGFCKYIIGKQIENLDNVVDLRVFGIFGKYEDYTIRFISNAICKTLFDLPITIKQDRKFDYIYIDDLMPVLEFFVEKKTKYKTYNITPDISIKLSDIAKTVKKIANKDLSIIIANEGLGMEYSGDNSRIKAEMANYSNISIENSIFKLYNFYQNNIDKINEEYLLTDK